MSGILIRLFLLCWIGILFRIMFFELYTVSDCKENIALLKLLVYLFKNNTRLLQIREIKSIRLYILLSIPFFSLFGGECWEIATNRLLWTFRFLSKSYFWSSALSHGVSQYCYRAHKHPMRLIHTKVSVDDFEEFLFFRSSCYFTDIYHILWTFEI